MRLGDKICVILSVLNIPTLTHSSPNPLNPRSCLSIPSVIGTPAEIYEFGFEFWFFISGLLLSIVFVSHAVLPVLYDLNLTSAYEYLEIRFNSKWPRRLGAAIFILEVRTNK